jgi:tol-pal system protein YbgF
MDARKILLTALILWVGGVYAAPSQEEMNKRVTRLERLVESQTFADMLTRIESLQQEVQQLRGQLEEQNHALEGMQRTQRELYLDTDRRLSRLEQAAGRGTSGMTAPDKDPTETGAADDEQKAYQKAFDLLRELRYQQAAAAFNAYLERFPKGRNAPLAHYWLGEASYAQREFKVAIAHYQQLIDSYPKSTKVAEAMFKIGDSHRELGDKKSATKVLTELTTKYPNTTEAGQARTLLKQMKPKG